MHPHFLVRSQLSYLLNDASRCLLDVGKKGGLKTEPVGGIEPPSTDYETAALPLSYTGLMERMVAGGGVAPPFPAYETGVVLLDHPAETGGAGGDRTLVFALQERCSAVELRSR